MLALLPYALTPPTFRFRPLVVLAERLPLGGDREVVLATFVAARLLWDWSAPVPTPALPARAAGARQWLQSLSLPAATRGAFQHLVDAVSRGERPEILAGWARVIALSGRGVEAAARADLKLLAARLAGGPAHDGRDT